MWGCVQGSVEKIENREKDLTLSHCAKWSSFWRHFGHNITPDSNGVRFCCSYTIDARGVIRPDSDKRNKKFDLISINPEPYPLFRLIV